MEKNIIEVDLKSMEGVFNPFNENQISDELGNYIFRNSKKGSLNSKLTINIDDKLSLNDDEQERLVDAIREYFGLLVREKIIYSRYNSIKKLIAFMIGVLLILLSDAMSSFIVFLIPELFSIAGCVAIWEVAYNILFTDNKKRLDLKKLRELTECDIIFSSNKKK